MKNYLKKLIMIKAQHNYSFFVNGLIALIKVCFYSFMFTYLVIY